MTAALASMGPIGWCAAVAGSLLLYGCLAVSAGRFCAKSDPGEDGEFVRHMCELPPVPPSPRSIDDDADWLSQWPADTPIAVIEAAYYDREFWAHPQIAADMRETS